MGSPFKRLVFDLRYSRGDDWGLEKSDCFEYVVSVVLETKSDLQSIVLALFVLGLNVLLFDRELNIYFGRLKDWYFQVTDHSLG